jgi:DNA repair protein RecO (recombination protein O)
MDFTAGFVLHTRPYRDTSLIVDFFTLEQGRIGVVAKGAAAGGKRNLSRKASLQLFNVLALRWTGRGDLKNLTDVELLGRHHLFGQRLFAGLYLNELLERLLHRHDPYPNLYRHYAESISCLAGDKALEPILRAFEWQLLQELGYGLSFECDALSGKPIEPDRQYVFSEDIGLSIAPVGTPSNFHLSGQAILDCVNGVWHEQSLRTAKKINRQALRPLLGSVPLRSRSLFKQ